MLIKKLIGQVQAQQLDFRQEALEQELQGATEEAPNVAFGSLLGSVLSFVFAIATILVLLYLIWGALEWITASGDQSKLQKARDKITQSIIGIIVLSATIALFMVLQQFLGVCILDFFGAC